MNKWQKQLILIIIPIFLIVCPSFARDEYDCYTPDEKLWLSFTTWEDRGKENLNVSVFYLNQLVKHLELKDMLVGSTPSHYRYVGSEFTLQFKDEGSKGIVYFEKREGDIFLLEQVSCN